MRVALVAEHYPPSSGGVATSAQRVARSLSERGLNVQAICFDDTRPVTDAPYVLHETDGTVLVKRVGPFFVKQPREVLAQLDEKVKAAMRRQMVDTIIKDLSAAPPDVILSFYVLNAGFIAQFVAASLDVPVVAGVRGNDIGRNVFHVDRFAVTEWVLRRSSMIACVNAHLRDRLLCAWPELSDKVHVVPNSVAVTTQVSRDAGLIIRREIGWPETSCVIAFVGTLREKKGVAVLTSALRMLRDIDVRLLVIGPDLGTLEHKVCGSDWDELKRAGRVHITAQIPRERVPHWLNAVDVNVMPSVDDGMANGLLEGMAHGICPLASDIFTNDIDHGVDGLIVPRGRAEELCAAIRFISANRDAARRMGAQARLRVSERTPAMEAAAYERLLTAAREALVGYAR